MHDPVIATDGYTYERKAIEEWLKEKHISPVTGNAMPNEKLIPHFTLRHIIDAVINVIVSLRQSKETAAADSHTPAAVGHGHAKEVCCNC